MKVQKFTSCQAFKGQPKQEVTQPKYYCSTCTKCSIGNNCEVYQRRVEPNYNKCFYHSTYQPVVVIFKPLKNLETMIEEETKRKRLGYA